MPEFTKLLRSLCSIMSISGCEKSAFANVKALLGEHFDEVTIDNARNIVLVKKSLRKNAPKIMLDAHFDEIGMLVTGVTDTGLLRVAPVGGFDRSLLPASEVWVYGEEKLYGVFASVPPHLKNPKDTKAPEWSELLIDIGYPKAEAEKLAPIGTPVGYYYSGDELLGRRITSRSLDDKACAAVLICAVVDTPREELCYDVYVTLSAGEEIGGGGAKCAAYTIRPDLAIVTDVNFAKTPGVDDTEGGDLGGGPMLSLSSVTDRKITKNIRSLAAENDIPISAVVEPTNTGTNANSLVFSREGVRCAVLSLPIGGMHSYNELLDLDDADYFIRLVKLIITRGVTNPDNTVF